MSASRMSTGAEAASGPSIGSRVIATRSYEPAAMWRNSKVPVDDTRAFCKVPVATVPRRGTRVTAAPIAGSPVTAFVTDPATRMGRTSVIVTSTPVKLTAAGKSTTDAIDALLVFGKYAGSGASVLAERDSDRLARTMYGPGANDNSEYSPDLLVCVLLT